MFRLRFDVGTMLRVFELNVKKPAFAQQKTAQMRSVFFEELMCNFTTNSSYSYVYIHVFI